MKHIFLLFFTVILTVNTFAQQSTDQNQKNETTLIFTRHAEKMDTGDSDPSLNEAGKKRAVKLLNLMRHYDNEIDVIYSTDYKRTKETAAPLAEYFDLEINIYDAGSLKAFMEKVLKDHSGETVMIVGHSNTTPEAVNLALGMEELSKMDEDDYSNMYIVKIAPGGKPTLQKYKY